MRWGGAVPAPGVRARRPVRRDFFTYYEDVDWSLRAQLMGLACRYVPSAVVYHMGSATLGRESDFTRYQLWRNGIWLLAKDLPAGLLVRHGPDVLLGQLSHFGLALRSRRGRLWARAVRDALRGLPAMLRKRREVQGRRSITASELERRIASSLS